MKKKPIPIGIEDIKKMIDKDAYYVDKSKMICDLIDSASSVTLFTRPRRFGKTLNQSMIRRFFENELDDQGKEIDNSYIFKDLAVSARGSEYLQHQQKYPVIDLSLKSSKQPDFDMAYGSLINEISREYRRHKYLIDYNGLDTDQKEQFLSIMMQKADQLQYSQSLRFLSECLAKYHGRNTIILIDEYDVPLESAYFAKFYDEMAAFIRSLFEAALKTNPYLEFAVITGCLRISRESIFTGLNNLEINSILGPGFADYFGFTEDEIKCMLHYYDLNEKFEELQSWYDGYLFGNIDIYNPWSIINYVKNATLDRNFLPKPYWSNTSSNSIIRELVEDSDLETRIELEQLLCNGAIDKPIHEDITYEDIYESNDNLWNFLFFTGYLKACDQRIEGKKVYTSLTIPNKEIASIYEDTILGWFDRKLTCIDLEPLLQALETGDCDKMGALISEQLQETISFFDYGENYYHGFLAGLLKGTGKYKVLSNRESGDGRPDIILKTLSVRGVAMILELKVAAAFSEMEEKCYEALSQIEAKNYIADLRREGYSNIKTFGICFFRKECLVKEKGSNESAS